MIKVQTLRIRARFRGFGAFSLLALAACSGTLTNESGRDLARDHGALAAAATANAAASVDANAKSPQGQDPAGAQAMVQRAIENARSSMQKRLFEDARNEAAFALELDNDNAEAREIVRRCNELLGGQRATVGGQFADEVLRNRIETERTRAIVEKELEQANAYLQQQNAARAVESCERALASLRLSPSFQPNDPLLRRAEAMLESSQNARREALRMQTQSAQQATEDELRRIAAERQEARAIRIRRLVDDANQRFQDGQYADSVERLDQALMLDPSNIETQALRDLADRARHASAVQLHRERWRQEWNDTFIELQHANMPQSDTVVFDPARWSETVQRQPLSYSSPEEVDTPEDRAIQKKLDETVLEHNFASAKVDDWATYYGNLTEITFTVSPDVRAMDEASTTLNDLKLSQRSVASALKVIQAQTGVAYRIIHGVVELVPPNKARGKVFLDRYPVADLVTGFKAKPGPDLKLRSPDDDTPLFPEVDEDAAPSVVEESRLVDIIKESVAPGTWDDAESGFTINAQAGVLFVRADKETQAAVNHLLTELRRNVGIQVFVESRFLKVEDNFLEDVGVDLRGLGNQAAQGLAGRGLEKQGSRPNAGFDDYGPSQLQNPATPGLVGTGTAPGVFFDDGGDGDLMARAENLFDSTLGGRNGGLSNSGGLSLQYAWLDDVEVEAVLRAVSKQERSEQVDAPRLLIYNNTRASMHFLRNISYIKDFDVEIAQAAAVANPVIGIVHDGIALDVRPVVDADLKFITMELRPTVMQLQLPIPTFTTTLGVGQPISIQLPQVTLQRVRTIVTMPDGATMMLGGMRLVERQNLESNVPLLGNLPGLSWLFSRKGTSLQNRKVLILITAKIVIMEELEPRSIALPDGSIMTMGSR